MKNKQINIRLTEDVFNTLNFKSKAVNRNNSDYITNLILLGEVNVNNSKNIIGLISAINHIGNNLNQIARVLNVANKKGNLNEINYENILNELLIIESNLNEALRENR